MTTLPANLTRYLSAFAVRRRRVGMVRALGLAAIFQLSWMLLWCLADRLVPLPPAVRMVVLLLGVAGVVVLVRRPVGAVLRRRVDWVEAAHAVEQRSARFGERLVTVTSQLLAPPEQRGSEAMLRTLLGHVEEAVDQDEPRRLEPWGPALRPWVVVAGLLALIGALLPVDWLDLPRLMVRHLAPVADVLPATTTRISAWHEPHRVIEGDVVTITATAENLDEGGLTLRTSGDGQIWSARPMIAVGERYVATLPPADRSFRYFVSGGDSRTRTAEVSVLRRPRVTGYRVRYEYPAYMRREPLAGSSDDGIIEAPIGTHATIDIIAAAPLKDAQLAAGEQVVQTTATADPSVRQATIAVEKDVAYELRLVSAQGAEGGSGARLVVRAIADQQPLVRWVEPAEDLRLTPRDVLAVRYQAMDDYALQSLRVIAIVNGEVRRTAELRLRGDPRRQEGLLDIDLATLSPEYGDSVALRLKAMDGAGHVASSEPRNIVITPRSIDMGTYMRLSELAAAASLAKSIDASARDAIDAGRAAAQMLDEMDGWLARAEFDQHLMTISEMAVLLRQALLRALVHTQSAEMARSMAVQIDAAQRIASWADHLGGLEIDAAGVEPTLRAMQTLAGRLAQEMSILSAGEQAAAVIADRVNVTALEKRAAETKDEAIRRTARRAREELIAAVKRLNLDPNAPDLDNALQEKVHAAYANAARQAPVDFIEAATQWAAGEQPGAVPVALVPRLMAAAEAEAVRIKGDLVRARDLQLAAAAAEGLAERAVATVGPGASWEGITYPHALAALVREHELNQRTRGSAPPADAARIIDAAFEARLQMSRWADPGREIAGDAATAAQRERRLAMEAAAELAMRRYEQALALDEELERLQDARRQATTQPAGWEGEMDYGWQGMNGPMADEAGRQTQRALVRQATETVRRLDEISEQQAQVARETEAQLAGGDEPVARQGLWLGPQIQQRAHELESRQVGVAQAIDDVRRQVEDPLDLVADDQQPATQDRVMEAIQAVQERLAALPGQLSGVQQQTRGYRAALDAVARAEAELIDVEPGMLHAEGGPDARLAQVRRLVEHAQLAAQDARERVDEAAAVVSPEVSDAMAQRLRAFVPLTDGAVLSIDQNLTPALQSLRRAVEAADEAAVDRAASEARRAVGVVQEQLREAQSELAERDPLVAARWFARQAASSLAMRPPDFESATRSQAAAGAALSRAWQESVHRAAQYRLAGVAGMSSLYEVDLLGLKLGVGGGTGLRLELPATREWGRVRPHIRQDVTAGPRDSDPPGYHEALRAYFQALGQGQARDKQ